MTIEEINKTLGPVDPFFATSDDTEWNACVGPQGDAENYVDGYLEAALELAATVIDKGLIGSRDTLAMPILYNCRHGLELSLKYAIDRLFKTGMLKQAHPPNHDIKSLWYHLQSEAVGSVSALGDATLRQLVADIGPYVKSLAAIDEDGQELRYPQNRSGQTSLEEIPLVNLAHVHSSIKKLSELLQLFKRRVHQIEDERSTKTQTDNCSRKDLIEIARIVGDHTSWVDENFLAKKTLVMTQYGLSKGKFSDAIDAIRQSAPLSVLIGIEAHLKFLTDEKAIEALTLWASVHPLKKQGVDDDLGMDYLSRDWDKFKEWQAQTKALDEAILKLLSTEEFGDLETLYYLGRDGVFGEHYEDCLTKQISFYGKALTRENVDQIMSKTNLLDAFAKGCESIGRPSLAEKLRQLRAVNNAT